MLGGLAVCALLAAGSGPEPSAWSSGLALGAGCLLLGFGALGYVGAAASRAAIAAVAGCWGAAALITAWLQLAERAGVSPLRLRGADVLIGTSAGLGQLVCVGAALVVLGWAYRPFAPEPLVAVAAAAGVLAVATTGHAATGAWTPIVTGVHALAAAWWAGTLAALALTVRGRGGWARSLPEFSRYAGYAAALLAATGVAAAAGRLGLSADWVTTGYGRVALAKVAVLAAALALAIGYRRTWVPAAARHATEPRVSLIRAVIEIAVLSLAIGLGAGLAATMPPNG